MLLSLSACDPSGPAAVQATSIASSTESPTEAVEPPTPAPPTATPTPIPEETSVLGEAFLQEAGDLCDAAFEAGMTYPWTWAPKSPAVPLINRDYDEIGWAEHDEPDPGIVAEDLESIVCILETRIDKGIYIGTAGGGHGYQLQWDLWVLSWPEGLPQGSTSFEGGRPPSSVSTGGDHYGASPEDAAMLWVEALLAEPWMVLPSSASQLRFSEDGSVLVADLNVAAGVIDAVTGELIRETNYEEDGSFVPFVSFSITGDRFAATVCGEEVDGECVYNVVQVRESADGSLVRQLEFDREYPLIYDHAFTPDNRYLYVGYRGDIDRTTRHYVRRWDLRTGSASDLISNEVGGVGDIIISPDGRNLLFSEGGSSFQVYDLESGEQYASFGVNHYGIDNPMAYAPDGKVLAAAHCMDQSYDFCSLGLIKVLETEAYGEIDSFGSSATFIQSVAISADGALLAGGECQFVRTYTPEDGGPRPICTSAAVVVWDLESGVERYRFEGHSGEIRSLVFSPDGSYLYSAATDGSLRRWLLDQ
jgi:hypothetical protein